MIKNVVVNDRCVGSICETIILLVCYFFVCLLSSSHCFSVLTKAVLCVAVVTIFLVIF